MGDNRKRAAVFLAAGFEDSELIEPVDALRQAGVEVTLVGLASEDRQGVAGKKGSIIAADAVIDEVDPSDFDLLVIPGGKGPARLRQNQAIIDFTRSFDTDGKPIAAICHGPQVLVSAGLLKGRTATSYYKVAGEVEQAGATFVNQPVVVDGNLITSRQPGDIPAFIEATLDSIGLGSGARTLRKSG